MSFATLEFYYPVTIISLLLLKLIPFLIFMQYLKHRLQFLQAFMGPLA